MEPRTTTVGIDVPLLNTSTGVSLARAYSISRRLRCADEPTPSVARNTLVLGDFLGMIVRDVVAQRSAIERALYAAEGNIAFNPSSGETDFPSSQPIPTKMSAVALLDSSIPGISPKCACGQPATSKVSRTKS